MNAQDYDRNVYIAAAAAAGLEHRSQGGTGPAPDSLIDKHLAELKFDLAQEERGANSVVHSTPAPAPTLMAESRSNAPSEWRTRDGRSVPVLGREHRMASYASKSSMDPHEVAAGIYALATGDVDRFQAEARALSTTINTAGGFFLTEELASGLIDLARDRAVCIAAGARTIPMSSQDLLLIRQTADPTPGWRGEHVALTAGEPTFGQIALRAKSCGSIVTLSRELAEDAPNVAEVVLNSLTNAMALALDNAALSGDGTSTYGGIVGVLNNTELTPSTGIATPHFDDFIIAAASIEAINGTPTGIVMTPATKSYLARLKTAETLDYLTAPPAYTNLSQFVTNSIETSTAIVGQWDALLIGLRQGIMLEVSTTAGDAFSKHEVLIKATMRADVNIAAPFFVPMTGISY